MRKIGKRAEQLVFEEMNARKRLGVEHEKWEACLSELRGLGCSPMTMGNIQQLIVSEVGEGRVVLEAPNALSISSAIKQRITHARFPEINTIDQFDFDFEPSRKKTRARYLALHDLSFI